MVQFRGSLLDPLLQVPLHFPELAQMHLAQPGFIAQQSVGTEKGRRDCQVDRGKQATHHPEHGLLHSLHVLDDLVYVQVSLEYPDRTVPVGRQDRHVLLMQILDLDDLVKLVEIIGVHLARCRYSVHRADVALVVALVFANFIGLGRKQDTPVAAIDLDLDHRYPAKLPLELRPDTGERGRGQGLAVVEQLLLQPGFQNRVAQHDGEILVVRIEMDVDIRLGQPDVQVQQRCYHQGYADDAD